MGNFRRLIYRATAKLLLISFPVKESEIDEPFAKFNGQAYSGLFFIRPNGV